MDPVGRDAGGGGVGDRRIGELGTDRTIIREVGEVAMRAFLDDPFFVFLSPNRRLRERGLRIFWRGTVASFGDRAVLYGARDARGRLLGAAAYVRPGSWPLPGGAQARQAAAAAWALAPRPPALVSGVRYLAATEKAHPHEDLWYLALLVVDPDAQRSGLGAALQEQVNPVADVQGLPCYLETQKEANLAYYRRFGYEVDRELRPVKAGPPLWTMRREPAGR